MQAAMSGDHPGKASVAYLPIIDMPASNESCILSTLKFIDEHAKKHNVDPIVTFDQPLYWKAMMILETESTLKHIILRLGAFHTMMSYIGSIAYFMRCSGLQEVLETIYGEATVQHIFSGKAISRAIRAHCIIQGILNFILLCNSNNINIQWILMNH